MSSPVASSKVAISGADTNAGSSFTNLKNKGIAMPTMFPTQTTVDKDIPTVNARVICLKDIAAMVKAIMPIMSPSATPTLNSRNIIRHHSVVFISPVANARIMRVDDCDPVLPPDPVSIGMK